ncbi:MAG: hypothetical protein ACUVV0_04885 [Anaerolineae bacterium]
MLLGVLIAVVGYWGPWVHHCSAALILTGPDMGEFVKFLPQVRAGEERVFRQIFYLPPFAAALGLLALAGSSPLGRRAVPKFILLAFALALSCALLPPAFTPSSILSAEFRLQSIAFLVCLFLAFWQGVFGLIPRRFFFGLVLALCLAGAIFPLWQFLALRGAIQAVYGFPIASGWGLWAAPAGLLLTALSAGLGLTLPEVSENRT